MMARGPCWLWPGLLAVGPAGYHRWLLAAGRLVFSHFVKISTSGLPVAEQLYLVTLGDPTLQEDSLSVGGFVLPGLPCLQLGMLWKSTPAE